MTGAAAIAVVLLAVVAFSPPAGAAPEALHGFRLPNNTRPLHYDLHVTTRIDTQTDFTFTGRVAITLQGVGAASDSITLHHRNLSIVSAHLTRAAAPAVRLPLVEPHVYRAASEMLTFTLLGGGGGGGRITDGERYVLTIAYAGVLRTDAAGFYRSSYVNAAGERRWLATTQLEQTDARHAFPCYDEPALRARFTVRITHGIGYHAISNMPADGRPEVDGELTTTTFLQTPSMPTYLIAFVVSDFASISGWTPGASLLEQRVFARPNAIANAGFALDTGLKALRAFQDYFQIPFALPKLDQVAVPDFDLIAMENWGLVIYVESYLLYNESRSTFRDLNNIATVLAHEYAHQYFGNLVTPKWWSCVWLSEGFADLYENIATNWLFPTWKIMDAFALTAHEIMHEDATNRTRPMTFYVEEPDAIANVFDTIAYAKSACVLHMFMHAFTERVFRNALIDYLRAQQYSAADEDDLFNAIESAVKLYDRLPAHLDARTIMRSWSNQAGFPVLRVQRAYTTNTFTLTQHRYFSEEDPPAKNATAASSPPPLWWIPYNWATASSPDFSETRATDWLGTPTAIITATPTLNSDDWLLLNKRQTGYYRVQYDARNYALLAAALERNVTAIHLVSRAQLLNDAFALAHDGHQSYAAALALSRALANDVEYVPWAAAWRGFADIERLLAGSQRFSQFSRYAVKLVSRLFVASGLEAATDEPHYRKEARRQAIRWACEHGHAACLRQTHEAFVRFLGGGGAHIHQDHRAAVLCQGGRNASDAQSAELMARLRTEEDAEERQRYVDAMACAQSVKQLSGLLEASVRSEHGWIGEAERYRAFVQVAGKGVGWPLAAEFLRTRWTEAERRYGAKNVNAALERLAEQVNSDERKKKFNEVIEAAKQVGFVTASSIQSALRKVQENDRWLKTNRQVIEEFMEKNTATKLVVSSVVMVLFVCLGQVLAM